MIFITLGSQKFQFNRLLKKIDEIEINDEIVAQIGYSDYKPKHYKYAEFLDRDQYSELMGKADIVITHGGTGAIVGALKKGKKVIAVPRLAKYGEHVDDHQLQIIEQFKEMDLIYACEDMDLKKAILIVKNSSYNKYQSNTSTIINSLKAFIEELNSD